MPHRESDNRILDIVDDRLESRFESYAEAQAKLHIDFHKRIEKIVQETIQTTVNGKIQKATDAMNEAIARLDDKVAPSVTLVDWFTKAGKGLVWVAAAIASCGGAWLVIKKFFL